ncbi:FtsB family cell division protein [Clostridium felsineum]|uniref:Cell division protein FtsL n=1 Tax=Clostridium felsineum TaxID=36839 RepID=A0A1S8LG05_9CLOT|nr:septum formation initiator family protein [Clostridium felsineum]MCR3760792.1 septum formation initiator family protein [Clostridium felsineum]URZ03386.1 Cell division protein FtsL [Clostridium felsineum]URZ08296.1 Cell division protein FtsL [Clostridium felsineum]URZ13327.1 Cell division protein FtsL [Clostridium felsineum]URZ14692.1 Cell division protein FtsL [Clostridium felsineum DSM 794]
MKMGSKIKYIVFFIVLINMGYIFVKQQITINRINKNISESQKNIDSLKKENQKLQDEIKLSKTDSYTEKLAREKLGLIKQGEIPVIDNKK